MIKTPLSTVIGGAFWTPGSTVIGGQQSFSQLIKKLFANNDQGFFYDPNDLSTMFQDAAGTIPVTGSGQPVGLILDKSNGLVLGTESVVNWNFDDLAAWSTYNNPTRSVQNGILKLEAIQSISGIYQDIPLPSYSTCKVVVRARKVSGASFAGIFIMPRTGNFNAPNTNVEIIGDSFKDYTFHISKEAAATGIRVYLQVQPSDAVIEVDSVSVKGIAGNHAYQTTSASRPILRKNAVTGANYLEFDGTDDFLQTANINFTGTDKVSLFAGVRNYAISGVGVLVELSSNADNTINKGSFYLAVPSLVNFHAQARGTLSTASFVSVPLSSVAKLPSIFTAKYDLADKITLRLDSLQTEGDGSNVQGGFNSYPLYIGRRNGTVYPFIGHIYSLIGVGKLVSANETVTIEKELAKRLGVTLNV